MAYDSGYIALHVLLGDVLFKTCLPIGLTGVTVLPSEISVFIWM